MGREGGKLFRAVDLIHRAKAPSPPTLSLHVTCARVRAPPRARALPPDPDRHNTMRERIRCVSGRAGVRAAAYHAGVPCVQGGGTRALRQRRTLAPAGRESPARTGTPQSGSGGGPASGPPRSPCHAPMVFHIFVDMYMFAHVFSFFFVCPFCPKARSGLPAAPCSWAGPLQPKRAG